MRKFYVYFFFLMLPILASAQLYIKSATAGSSADSTFIFNKGEILFVNQNIGMDGNPDQTGGNLYLRNQGQLIQGLDEDVKDNGENILKNATNSGTGIASVFQINSMNKWDYHFWASPVGDPESKISGYSGTNSGNKKFYQTNLNGGGLYQPTNTPIVSDPITLTTSYDGIITTGNKIQFSSYWLYKYVASSGYSGYEKISQSNELNPGEGFTMKGVGDNTTPTVETIDFRGIPNNGTINVKVLPFNLTLIGNPYPSAMNLSYYLLSNSGATSDGLALCLAPNSPLPRKAVRNTITGEAYFWQSNPNAKSHYLVDYEGGYGTFTPGPCNSSGTYTPATFVRYDNDGSEIPGTSTGAEGAIIQRHIAPVGQGFYVEGLVGATDNIVTAKNEFRVFIKESKDNYSEFKRALPSGKSKLSINEKKSEKDYNLKAGGQAFDDKGYVILPKFYLQTFINNTYNRSITGVMYEGSTMGKDRAMDGYNLSDLVTDVSFKLEGTNRAIITNYFPYDLEARLALNIKGDKETNKYRMQVSDLNFTSDSGIWLYDKTTDTYHDILNDFYEFELPKGSYSDRFEITFKDFNAIVVEEEEEKAEEIKQSFAIYQNNSRSELTVLNPLETELKEINVFDIAGRLLVSKINEGTNAKVTIPSNAWSDGVYIIRVITRDKVEFSKKIAVKNLK